MTRNNNCHKARRQSITWVRGSWLNNFTLGEQAIEGSPCVRSIPWPQSWEQHATPLVPVYQELISNRGFVRNRKQHAEILKLNVPWQFPLFHYICKKDHDHLSLLSLNNFCRKTTVYNKYKYQDNYQSYSSRPNAMSNALKQSLMV